MTVKIRHIDKLPNKVKSKQFPDCRHFFWPDLLCFPSLGNGLDTHILYSDLPMRFEVSNDIFLQHYFTRETEISSLSLVSMSRLLVSFRQFEKSLRLNASDLCCYKALGNMLGDGIYGFSAPGKYI